VLQRVKRGELEAVHVTRGRQKGLRITRYVLVIVRLARRELVWINVTAHPTTEWIRAAPGSG